MDKKTKAQNSFFEVTIAAMLKLAKVKKLFLRSPLTGTIGKNEYKLMSIDLADNGKLVLNIVGEKNKTIPFSNMSAGAIHVYREVIKTFKTRPQILCTIKDLSIRA